MTCAIAATCLCSAAIAEVCLSRAAMRAACAAPTANELSARPKKGQTLRLRRSTIDDDVPAADPKNVSYEDLHGCTRDLGHRVVSHLIKDLEGHQAAGFVGT